MKIRIIETFFCFGFEKRVRFHSSKWFVHCFAYILFFFRWKNVVIFDFYRYGIICSNRSRYGLRLVNLRIGRFFAFYVRNLIGTLCHVIVTMVWFFNFRFAGKISWLIDIHGLNWVNKIIGKHSVSMRNLLCWW